MLDSCMSSPLPYLTEDEEEGRKEEERDLVDISHPMRRSHDSPKLRIYIWGPSIFSIHSLSCSVLHRNTPPLGHPTSCFMPGCVGRKNKWWLMFDQVAQIKGVGRVLSSIQHGGHASQVHTQDVFGKYTNSLHYLTLHTFKWRRFKSIYALTLSLWRKWKL